jgi:hypothetical protein
MEDIVNLLGFGKIDLNGDMRDFGSYLKRSVLPW